MVKVFVNNIELEIDKNCTVFQACYQAGIEIPRFCYHERLSIAGNCRMCLVEVEKSPKPVASCAMPVMEGMKIKTNTPLVKKAREGVLEFLLINHPLDCPICDQGGECDLQDLTMVYGSDRGRFHEYKRSVEDKNLGPLIKTIMTRCIHCTRCVRFAEEVAGVKDLGTVGRGRETEIGTYVEKSIQSEMSGNLIDLCPVGALTSKPYAFTSRPWELTSIETIDVTDSIGSNIRVDIRGSSIMRILPRLNESINEEWISDKTRFSYDGLQRQRIHYPMTKKGDILQMIGWEEALDILSSKLKKHKGHQIISILGGQVDLESAFMIYNFMYKLGSLNVYFEKFYNDQYKTINTNPVPTNFSSNYTLNYSLPELEDIDSCLLIGANPRYESTLLNSRLRKRYLKGNFAIASIGEPIDLTYPVQHLGNDINIITQVLEGRHPFCKHLMKGKQSLILIGNSFLKRKDCEGILSNFNHLGNQLNKPNIINILHSYSGFVGMQEISCLNMGEKKDLKLENLGKSELIISFESNDIPLPKSESNYIVHVGHHGDQCAEVADLILPSSTFVEKENSTYLNLEGRSQRTKLVLHPPAEAKETWEIIRAASEMMGLPEKFDDKDKISDELAYSFSPHAALKKCVPTINNLGIDSSLNRSYKLSRDLITCDLDEKSYYHTDETCRASSVMAQCIKSRHQKLNKEKTNL
tara:strand:+ start:22687 stop:24774 length:2088 start_codon:yes stop_codon:yes gene_type:complete